MFRLGVPPGLALALILVSSVQGARVPLYPTDQTENCVQGVPGPCPPGEGCFDRDVSCKACPPGTYSNATDKVCYLCEEGTYGKGYSRAACEPCGGEVYSSLVGSTSCELCPVGFVTSTAEAASCDVDCTSSLPGTNRRGFVPDRGVAAGDFHAWVRPFGEPGLCRPCGGSIASYFDALTKTCVPCPPGVIFCQLCQSGSTIDYYPGNTGNLGVVDNACRECPTGMLSNGDKTGCEPCAAGEFRRFSSGSSIEASCVACTPGFVSTPASDECVIECPAGSEPGPGLLECTPCPLGYYKPLPGNGTCVACPDPATSTMEPGSISVLNCSASCTSEAFFFNTSSVGCETCPALTQTLTSADTSCPLGACEAQYQFWDNSAGPAGDLECPQCAKYAYGFDPNVPERTGCSACAPSVSGGANFFSYRFAYNGFDTGTFDPRRAPVTCSVCGRNAIPIGGVCTKCPVGTTATEDGVDCVPCGAGQYREGVMLDCQACPPGRFGASPTGFDCRSCNAGTVQPMAGATSCISCAAGRFAVPQNAQLACQDCLPGYFSDRPLRTECLSCETFAIQPYSGRTHCDNCLQGTFPNPTSTACVAAPDCPAGGYEALPPAQFNVPFVCFPCNPGTSQNTSGAVTSCNHACEPEETGMFAGLVTCPEPDATTILGGCGLAAIPVGPNSPGSYDARGGNACALCLNGEAGGATDAYGRFLDCVECPAGSSLIESLSRFNSLQQLTGGGCIECELDHYKPWASSGVDCQECPFGQHAEPVVQSQSDMPTGWTWLPRSGAVLLPDNSTFTAWTISKRLFWDEAAPIQPPVLGVAVQGATSCQQCPVGTVSDTNTRRSRLPDACARMPVTTLVAEDASYGNVVECKRTDIPVEVVDSFGQTRTVCRLCPPGNVSAYQPFDNTYVCQSPITPCGWTAGSHACYTATVGNTTIATCKEGSEQIPPTATAVCVECPPGKFSSDANRTCTTCPAGRVQPYAGQSTCHQCTRNQYVDQPSLPCLSCDDPTADGDNCAGTQCPAGSGSDLFLQGVKQRVRAEPNPVPFASVQGGGPGSRPDLWGQYCLQCEPGLFRPDGHDVSLRSSPVCQRCGLFQSSLDNATSCFFCNPGWFAAPSIFAPSGCQECEAGSYGTLTPDGQHGARCFKCPADTYSNVSAVVNLTSCLPCAPGATAPPGSTSCLQGPCTPGTEPNGAGGCQVCAAGRFSTNGTVCENCGLGESTFGQTTAAACGPCQPGFFANTTATPACHGCAAGTAAPDPGSTGCTDCTPTTVSPGSQANCTLCQGTTYPNDQLSACRFCADGTGFNATRFADDDYPPCDTCPVAFFSNTVTNGVCLGCPAHQTTNGTGSVSDQACYFCPHHQRPDLAAGGCVSCDPNQIGGGTGPCVTCQAGEVPNVNQTACEPVVPSSSPSASISGSPSSSPSASVTASQTASPSASQSPGISPSNTASQSASASNSGSVSASASVPASPSSSSSQTPSASVSASVSGTASQTPSESASRSVTPSRSDSASTTPSASVTPSITPTISVSSSTAPLVCPAGQYLDATTHACTLCPPYTHAPVPNTNSSCAPCMANDEPGYAGSVCRPILASTAVGHGALSHTTAYLAALLGLTLLVIG